MYVVVSNMYTKTKVIYTWDASATSNGGAKQRAPAQAIIAFRLYSLIARMLSARYLE